MTTRGSQPASGFQFPGLMEISAVGQATLDLDRQLTRLVASCGVVVVDDATTVRRSSTGRYQCVRVCFHAPSRGHYDRVHQAVRDHPDVRWTL